MSVQDERRTIGERLGDLERKYESLEKEAQKKTDALKKIAEGSKHAKEIAQQALGWPDKMDQHIELLREENLRLKLELEKIRKEQIAKVIEDVAKKPWPHKSKDLYGGWHLCGRCGRVVINGQRCDYCAKNPFNPQPLPFGNPVWCDSGK